MPALGGPTVLVVEPDADAAAAQTAVLRLLGLDAREARTAKDAVAVLGKFRPKVVVTSLDLPDSLALTRHVLSADDPPAVVVLSGRTDATSRQAAAAAGAVEYRLKPIDPVALAELVRLLAGS
jgi:DNA-binding response OmpR family regulator